MSDVQKEPRRQHERTSEDSRSPTLWPHTCSSGLFCLAWALVGLKWGRKIKTGAPSSHHHTINAPTAGKTTVEILLTKSFNFKPIKQPSCGFRKIINNTTILLWSEMDRFPPAARTRVLYSFYTSEIRQQGNTLPGNPKVNVVAENVSLVT